MYVGNLRSHSYTLLCVKVGEGLVHKEDSYLTNDSTSNGNSLTLTARKCSRFSVKIIGKTENFRSSKNLLLNNVIVNALKGKTEGKIVVIDIYAGEEKIIMPTKSPFGFNFITRVISLFDGVFQPASKENPFGNMWMFAMLSDGNFDMKDMLMLSMMTGNNIAGNVNPMMLMAMADSKDKANDWILPMMLMNGGAFNQSKS